MKSPLNVRMKDHLLLNQLRYHPLRLRLCRNMKKVTFCKGVRWSGGSPPFLAIATQPL
jgi:hypothetical protein